MEQLNALCQELVEKSLTDEGNIAYDYFVSGTRDGVMMICETWQNAKVLKLTWSLLPLPRWFLK